MGNRTNYGTGRMTVDNRKKNERSRTGNPYSSHVKAGKYAGTVYNFKRKSRIRKSLTKLSILLEFIHKYIFLNFVSFYNGLNSNEDAITFTDSRSMFENLWEEWFDTQLFLLAKGTPMAGMGYNEIFQCLPKEKQEELMNRKAGFAKTAGIE